MAVIIPNGGQPPLQSEFSNPNAVTNQTWLNAAMASRYAQDPIIRKIYYCNVLDRCKFGTWLTENMGYATSCYTNYSIYREYPSVNKIKISNGGTVPANGSSTVNLTISSNSHYVGGAYVLPQVGDGVLLPPDGTIGIVTAVTPSTNATVIAVRRMVAGDAVVVANGDELIVLAGQQLADCACPSGKLRIKDAPVEQELSMFPLGTKTGEICGDALLACQNLLLPYTYTDANGCSVEAEMYYGGALQEMYNDHEEAKWYHALFNDTFGIIPTLRAESIRWNWADPTELTVEDIADLKEGVQKSGINCFEYSFFLGSQAFASAQFLANSLANNKISYGAYNPEDSCKHINLNFCTISTAGMTIHFHEECSFSDGNALGAVGFEFDNRGIGLPMCDKPAKCPRYGEGDNKMFTIVHFKDNRGVIHDNLTDSNGILNGVNGRNTFGTGCDSHEWSIKSRFTVEVACPYAWVLVNFPA